MTVIRKPTRKIGLIDMHAIGIVLEVAAVAVEPEEYSYRTVFRKTMPKLYVMRQHGMSFRQLHRLLHQAGFPIALTTLRTYYSKCLLEMRGECEQYLRKLDRVMKGAGKAANVDLAQLRAAKTAVRSAVTAEENTGAAAAIRAFATFDTTAGGATVAPAPATREAAAPPRSPEPSTGPELSPASAPAHCKPQPPVVAVVAPVAAPAAPSRATRAARQAHQPLRAAGAPGSPHCLTAPSEAQIEVLDGLPPEALSDALLEHPAIPALMLTRAQRLFVGRLEYRDAAGSPCLEKGTEMMNRREWKPAVPPSVGRTSGDFVEFDTTIIGRRKTR
ncbi:hypothetical protein FVF58_12120 [Paraburkholderia panacisoli]|uniref:Uncharacterized protein n=1 Tax=Paraburkholderia panacisoli TaxID=2603818 RepID=A0A5B0HC27_9BURK|nr:hypothetical protein [Paraburkholderia panacisoli]KAA1012618.1 hypothetical protein FVF58_12120 [Paraburkholderia panacisoli]